MNLVASRKTLLMAATALSLAGNAWAELPGDNPLLNKRFAIGIGGFFPEIDTTIRLDSALGPGTEIDFEDELGFEDSKDVGWLNARWRISERNNLEFEWTSLNRDATRTATTKEYDIGDSTLQAGGKIDSIFDIDLYRITYGFSLIRSDKADLQLQAGLHIADFTVAMQLSGQIQVGGSPVVTDSSATEGGDLTAPLPHFGGNFTYAFTDKFGFYGNILGFAIEIDNIEGSILDVGGTLQYNFTPNFGLGAGVRFFQVSVDAKAENRDLYGEFEFDYLGPVVYASVTF